jgi:hypothetical protein
MKPTRKQYLAEYYSAFNRWQSAPPALRPMIIGRIVQLEFEVAMTWSEEDAEACSASSEGRLMANGKLLRECTIEDIRDFAEFFTQLSKAAIEACKAIDAMPAWLTEEDRR